MAAIHLRDNFVLPEVEGVEAEAAAEAALNDSHHPGAVLAEAKLGYSMGTSVT